MRRLLIAMVLLAPASALAQNPTVVKGSLLRGTGTNAWGTLDPGPAGRFLKMQNGLPEWAVVELVGGISGVLPLANGGTNAALVASNGGIFYSTATAGAILSGTATANRALLSGASAAPAWSVATYPVTTTANQLIYSSAANVITGLATASNGVLVTSGAGVPSIGATLPTAVQDNITRLGTIAIGTWNGGTIGVPYGGTGATTFTSNGLLYGNGTGAFGVTSAGADGQLLLGVSSAAPAFATMSGDATIASSGAIALASIVTAATNTKLTYDAKGRVTAGTAAVLASSDYASQGTATTVLHGNAAGNPSWAAVALATDVSGTLPATSGGTGQSAVVQGDLLYGSAADTWARLPKDTGATRYLANTGASNGPAWALVDLTNGVTGTLPVGNGGTNATTVGSAGSVNYSTGTAHAYGAAGSTGQILHSGGTGAPTWAAVDLASATETTGVLPIARGGTNSSEALSGSGSIVTHNGTRYLQGPAGTTTTVLHGNAAGQPTYSAVSLTADVSGVLPVANGGTNVTSYTAGSVVFAGAGGTSLTQDNSNFFWDDSNNRLGIGNASPSYPLHVKNAGYDQMTVETSNAANGAEVRFVTPSGLLSSVGVFGASHAEPDVLSIFHSSLSRISVFSGGNVTVQSGIAANLAKFGVVNGTAGSVVLLGRGAASQSGDLLRLESSAPATLFAVSSAGAVTTGTWSATAIAANKGGTGLTSYTVGDLLYADTTSTLDRRAAVAVGSVLASAGTGTAPVWSSTPQVSRLGVGAAADASDTVTVTGAAVSGGAQTIMVTPGTHTTVTQQEPDIKLAPHTFTITASFDDHSSVYLDRPTVDAASALTITRANTALLVAPPVTTGSNAAIAHTAMLRLGEVGKTTTLNNTTSQQISALVVTGHTYELLNTTTALDAMGVRINGPTVNKSGAGSRTVTTGASLYVAGALTAGTDVTIANNYALFVDSGTTRLDGTVLVGGATAPQTTSGQTPISEFHQASISNTDADGATVTLFGTTTQAANLGSALALGAAYTGTTLAVGGRYRIGKEDGTAGNYAFYTAFDTRNNADLAERMRITAAGLVGIGTTAPNYKLGISTNTSALPTFSGAAGTVLQIGAADGETTRVVMDTFGAAAPNLTMRRANGTNASKTATAADDVLGQVSWFGYQTTTGAYSGAAVGAIRGNAAEAFTSTAMGTYLTFHTTPKGSTTVAEGMRLTAAPNLKIGGTAERVYADGGVGEEGTKQIVLYNGTAPVGLLTNGVSIYSDSGELKVMDAAGNATLLSPHDLATNDWVYDSVETKTGRRLHVRLERLLKALNHEFGWDYVRDDKPEPKPETSVIRGLRDTVAAQRRELADLRARLERLEAAR